MKKLLKFVLLISFCSYSFGAMAQQSGTLSSNSEVQALKASALRKIPPKPQGETQSNDRTTIEETQEHVPVKPTSDNDTAKNEQTEQQALELSVKRAIPHKPVSDEGEYLPTKKLAAVQTTESSKSQAFVSQKVGEEEEKESLKKAMQRKIPLVPTGEKN